MFNQERSNFTEKDYINNLLVDKYQDMMTVNPEKYGVQYTRAEVDKYSSDGSSHDCGCFYCRNYECEESEEMSEENEDIKEEDMNEEKDWTNPNVYYERLGVDILCIHVGQGFLPLFLNCYESIFDEFSL